MHIRKCSDGETGGLFKKKKSGMNKFSPNLNSKTLRPNINVLPCSPTVTNAWCACLPFRVSLGCTANRSRLIFYTPLSKVLFKIELYCISVCLSPCNWNSVHTACIGSLRHTNQPALCTACIYARTASHAPCTPGARPPPLFEDGQVLIINIVLSLSLIQYAVCWPMMTRVFVLVAALAVAGTMLASLTEAKGALVRSMHAPLSVLPQAFLFFSLPKLSQNRTKYFYSKP